MSLILEALKKSEARRQLGEAPGLGTPFTVARRRRSPLPIIVILILVAVGLGWYYLRATPPTASVGATSAPNAPAAAIASKPNPQALSTTPTRTPDAGTIRANPPSAPSREPAAGEMAAAKPPLVAPPGAAGMRGDPRARGAFNRPGAGQPNGGSDPAAGRSARFQPGVPGAANAAPNLMPDLRGSRAQNVAAAAATGSGTAQPPTTQPQAPPGAMRSPASVAGAQTAAATTPANAASPPPAIPGPAATTAATPAAPATASAAPDLPLYYELPFNLRKDLPALAVSMHVYAAVPTQRFVVIDGERKAEGEVVKEGLTLREIRSDGIVLDLRGQRFFYPRPGR